MLGISFRSIDKREQGNHFYEKSLLLLYTIKRFINHEQGNLATFLELINE